MGELGQPGARGTGVVPRTCLLSPMLSLRVVASSVPGLVCALVLGCFVPFVALSKQELEHTDFHGSCSAQFAVASQL